jgi:hypothetical protein
MSHQMQARDAPMLLKILGNLLKSMTLGIKL